MEQATHNECCITYHAVQRIKRGEESLVLVKDMARNDAQDTLDTYWDGTFPVNPFRIAEAMGIRTTKMLLDDETSGIIVARPETQATIYIEERDTRQRQQFTCAHELGHYVERSRFQDDLAEGFSFVDKRTNKRDIHEFYADEFAGNLLMPRAKVDELHDKGVTLIKMAGFFGVSVPAMEVRLRRLGIDLIPQAS